ncbi:MAG: ChaN family lipoprotein [Alphaproteobacteria bacterium]|nr:ChaN family lipoprotein [Alphaproteobacteria bacterium]
MKSPDRHLHLGRAPRGIAGLALLLVLATAAACSWKPPLPAPLPVPPWQSTQLRDHPLTGRVWLPGDDEFITPAELFAQAARSRYLLLGERHDNADHHRIQAWMTAARIGRGARPALVMEMFRQDQQPAIDAHLRARPGDSAGLGGAAGWSTSGWGNWSHYEPIVRPVVQNRLFLIAANISRARVKEIYRKGYAALPRDRRGTLGLDRPMPAGILAAIDKEMADSHCGMVDERKARPLTRIQVVRDATFAAAMIRGSAIGEAMALGAPGSGGAILIAGAGHARTDRGVPLHLRRKGIGDADIFSLGLIEVAEGKTEPGAYAATYNAGRVPFDAVWFTPRWAREDPCEKFKKKYRKRSSY